MKTVCCFLFYVHTSMLTITNTDHAFELDASQCRDLELKLNVTSKGHEWIGLGDHLYAYATNKVCNDIMYVTNYQFDFLQKLITTSQKDCYNL